MREIVSLHVGQAGVQLGAEYWRRSCLEYGTLEPTGNAEQKDAPSEQEDAPSHVYFHEEGPGNVVPRALWIDSEPCAVESVRGGALGGIVRDGCVVTGKESAANNFARGLFTCGRWLVDECMDKLRRQIERCSCTPGFMLQHSMGGGTGSGASALLLAHMQDEFPGHHTLSYSVFPSERLNSSIVEPFNALLGSVPLMEHDNTVSVLLENQRMYKVAQAVGLRRRVGLADVNRVAGDLAVNVSHSFALGGGQMNMDLSDLYHNLVPFRDLHFMQASSSLASGGAARPSLEQMTHACFDAESVMCRADRSGSKYIAAAVMYSGRELLSAAGAQRAISTARARKDVSFVDWCPTGVRLSFVRRRPSTAHPNRGLLVGSPQPDSKSGLDDKAWDVDGPRSVMVANSTGTKDVFRNVVDSFKSMYARRAFVHWYLGEGLEKDEMDEACQQVETLIDKYDQANNK